MDNLFERSLSAIPCGSQTYSKSHKYFTHPFFASHGEGAVLYDTNDKPYDDYSMALGAVILGYKSKAWLQSLNIPDGFNFSAPHPLEVELAEKLISIIPSAEMVKFFKNGSDATEIAVRLARAYTGRKTVVSFGYHGFHDWYVSAIDKNNGVMPNDHIQNRIPDTKHFNCQDIAAVILEPAHPDTLKIVEQARRYGILIIFDEVLTGFRYDIGGYQKILGITPDLSCFGKCMANGLPLSAVVGRRDIMQMMDSGGVFASSTFGGETLSLAAALKTINELERNKDTLWEIGGRWANNMKGLIESKGLTNIMRLEGLAPRCGVVFNDKAGITAIEYQSLYQQELLKRGILTHGMNNFCLAHTEEQIDYFIECADTVLNTLKKARDEGTVRGYLERTIQVAFRR